jgi:hypothetical protein
MGGASPPIIYHASLSLPCDCDPVRVRTSIVTSRKVRLSLSSASTMNNATGFHRKSRGLFAAPTGKANLHPVELVQSGISHILSIIERDIKLRNLILEKDMVLYIFISNMRH